MTGFFFDPNNVVHGFVREADAGALGLPKFYRTVTPGRPMPLRKRHSLPEIIAHERLRPALTPAEVQNRPSWMSGSVQTAHEEKIPVSIRLWCEAL
ncbi:MAG: hypothetical protein WAN04_04605 [Candidatus Udaeobacter sp.]